MKTRLTETMPAAVAQAAMSLATAYRIESAPRLPSPKALARGRRRPDPLVDIFDAQVVPMLQTAPGLRPMAIFKEHFMARLTALVPTPRVNLARYHGVFAPNHRLREQITPARHGRRKAQTTDEPVPPAFRPFARAPPQQELPGLNEPG